MERRRNFIVAGSRSFDDYETLAANLNRIFREDKPTAILCGEARGADTLGKRYAGENHIRVISFPADRTRYGRRAGFIRNAEMLKHADALVAFWDRKSFGTRHMIEIARKKGIYVRVIRVGKESAT